MRFFRIGLPLLCLTILAASATAQRELSRPAELVITPAKLELKVGEEAQLTAKVMNAAGEEIEATVIFLSLERRSLGVSPDGAVSASQAGEFTIAAIVPIDPEETGRNAEPLLRIEIPVTVAEPAIESLEFVGLPSKFYAGTMVAFRAIGTDEMGARRENVTPTFRARPEDVVSVDASGLVTLIGPGSGGVMAQVDGARAFLRFEVEANPVASIELTAGAETARTGDVVRFTAIARAADGSAVEEIPIRFATFGQTAANIVAAGSTAQIEPDGRFVAERSGQYTILATTGSRTAMKTIKVTSREVWRAVEVVGHGKVSDRHTSDLWIWEGPDGKDYAITGTWGAEGHAYIWDVTDPANMSIVDVVKVDARTVNDVKVSEDGRIAVISREGASNRRNGIVVLDVSNPQEGVRIISSYDDELTGGVHNIFIHQNHVYAVNNGRRFDVINIANPYEPYRVGRFELPTPGHGIHDVWVVDGIAYTSNWRDGVVAIDVGGGDAGGSPERPVQLGQFAYPNGRNHAAFPFRSKSTGKFYVVAGDESFPSGLNQEEGGLPTRPAGWMHFIEWDEWGSPREVARYQVPEAGTHNLWIEDDILYIGYYNAGLRVVDVSGELLGDLYQQGREIASFITDDPKGYISNAPMVWGPQPYKGNIFVADWNSGLWALKLGATAGANPILLEDRE